MNSHKWLDDPAQRRSFRHRLLKWYDANQRALPWRGERDPYRVWVSEIMLQQTRANVVCDYYARFLKRFPTVEALARARESTVLAAWSGLGYYRRARAMHAAARQIVECRKLPQSAKAWRELPGIGRYTAAAIASLVFDQSCALVDGNVERVLARMFGGQGNRAWHLAQQLISRHRPGDFNQAMMELGATVCLPPDPLCGRCPVVNFCASRGTVPRVPSSPRKRKQASYGYAQQEDCVYLVRRPPSASLMSGMWELPELPAKSGNRPLLELRHSITNTDYRVSVFPVHHLAGGNGSLPPGRWIIVSRIAALPLTGLARKILCRLGIIQSSRRIDASSGSRHKSA